MLENFFLLIVAILAQKCFSAFDSDSNTLVIGRSLNIFSRFGYLSVTMKVVARNDTQQDWIFREPTCDILQNVNQYVIRKISKSAETQKNSETETFPGNFHMEFCDNRQQLIQAYFRDIIIERFDRPWRAFAASWHPESIAKHFGITDFTFINEKYCFILIRLNLFRESVYLDKLPTNITFMDRIVDEVQKLQIGDTVGIVKFIRKYGSHYIDSYTTGDSLYQVFVFRKSHYYQIKNRFVTYGYSNINNDELNEYFSPWKALHIGQIRTSSGNRTIEKWCFKNLQMIVPVFKFQSILKLHENDDLFQMAQNLLTNEALLQIRLKSIEIFFQNDSIKRWFQEVLENLIVLWDVNL